ncbi:MAG: HAMP domain-containing histidine kinase [Lachnospiraceae bacterium]|nr:HAMP domain-containing histidine kinase [Lachnospiraceae bacterium]
MKHEKIGIKWKIFIYLLGFTAVLLVLLWIFQTVYLDEFYKNIKTSEIESAFENIESVIDEEDLTEAVELIATSYDICILVTNMSGIELYSYEQNMQCTIHKQRFDKIKYYIYMAQTNGGTYTEKIEKEDEELYKPDEDGMEGNKNIFDYYKPDRFHNMPDVTTAESILKVNIYERSDGQSIAVMINSVITPVDATVHTLRIQLIYISIIMIILALLIAMIISLKISKPIIKINDAAKELGRGDYGVTFEGNSYKEIAQLSDTLNHATHELAKAESLQRELIANVSHDLRTPLTMITAYSEVMRDLPGENTPENVQVVIDEAKRLTNLVNDLLDISKLQAGVTELELKEYDLTESIDSVLERYSKFLEQNGFTINFEYDRHVVVSADEFKIYQVIYNLVNNAINYAGDDKSVTVRQRITGSIVHIEVSDTGKGIAKEELENVWERYYKVDKSHKRAMMGTGLGLSIVKNILKLHNAQFGVNSEEGVGTTFWFELKTNLN